MAAQLRVMGLGWIVPMAAPVLTILGPTGVSVRMAPVMGVGGSRSAADALHYPKALQPLRPRIVEHEIVGGLSARSCPLAS
jgi:hypothetical protein